MRDTTTAPQRNELTAKRNSPYPGDERRDNIRWIPVKELQILMLPWNMQCHTRSPKVTSKGIHHLGRIDKGTDIQTSDSAKEYNFRHNKPTWCVPKSINTIHWIRLPFQILNCQDIWKWYRPYAANTTPKGYRHILAYKRLESTPIVETWRVDRAWQCPLMNWRQLPCFSTCQWCLCEM